MINKNKLNEVYNSVNSTFKIIGSENVQILGEKLMNTDIQLRNILLK